MRYGYLSILASFALCTACAAPRWENSRQSFVSGDQLTAVDLAREAAALYSSKRYADAELKLRQAAYLRSSDNLRANLANALAAQRSFDEALEIYRDLIAKNPRSTDYYTGLGRTLFAAGEFRAGSQALERAIDLSYSKKEIERGKIAGLERSLAVLSFKAGWEEEALCHSRNAVNLDSGPEQLSRHVRLLVATGRLEEADDIVTGYYATDAAKPDGALYHYLALIRFHQGNYAEARDLEEKALDAVRSPTANGSENRLEMVMVKGLAEEKTGGPVVSRKDLEEEEKQEEIARAEEMLTGSLESLSRQDQKLTLYWPTGVLEAYQKEAESIE